jgi:malonyl-CoA O-methyltransferase
VSAWQTAQRFAQRSEAQAGAAHRVNILPRSMTMPDAQPSSPGAQPSAVRAHLRRAGAAAEAPWLHGEVARRMAGRLAVVKAQPAVVLDWWSALGGGRAALRAQYPKARIEAVEPTAALVARSAHAAHRPWWSPRRWREGEMAMWQEDVLPPGARAQLLWSNLMLHWEADPAALFARWQAALEVDGFVMFSCFGPDTVRELHALYRGLGWAPPGDAFIDMHDLGDALLQAGFADPVMDMERLTLTWADAGAALAELRTLGGNASAARTAGLRTPRWRERLVDAMQRALAGPDGRLHLGFELVYGHAFKPAPRLRVAPETRVPLDTLRAAARAAGASFPSDRGGRSALR